METVCDITRRDMDAIAELTDYRRAGFSKVNMTLSGVANSLPHGLGKVCNAIGSFIRGFDSSTKASHRWTPTISGIDVSRRCGSRADDPSYCNKRIKALITSQVLYRCCLNINKFGKDAQIFAIESRTMQWRFFNPCAPIFPASVMDVVGTFSEACEKLYAAGKSINKCFDYTTAAGCFAKFIYTDLILKTHISISSAIKPFTKSSGTMSATEYVTKYLAEELANLDPWAGCDDGELVVPPEIAEKLGLTSGGTEPEFSPVGAEAAPVGVFFGRDDSPVGTVVPSGDSPIGVLVPTGEGSGTGITLCHSKGLRHGGEAPLDNSSRKKKESSTHHLIKHKTKEVSMGTSVLDTIPENPSVKRGKRRCKKSGDLGEDGKVLWGKEARVRVRKTSTSLDVSARLLVDEVTRIASIQMPTVEVAVAYGVVSHVGRIVDALNGFGDKRMQTLQRFCEWLAYSLKVELKAGTRVHRISLSELNKAWSKFASQHESAVEAKPEAPVAKSGDEPCLMEMMFRDLFGRNCSYEEKLEAAMRKHGVVATANYLAVLKGDADAEGAVRAMLDKILRHSFTPRDAERAIYAATVKHESVSVVRGLVEYSNWRERFADVWSAATCSSVNVAVDADCASRAEPFFRRCAKGGYNPSNNQSGERASR